jgi:hypothetical protein
MQEIRKCQCGWRYIRVNADIVSLSESAKFYSCLQICKAKYKDLRKRYVGCKAWFEELKKKRVAELKAALLKSEDSIGLGFVSYISFYWLKRFYVLESKAKPDFECSILCYDILSVGLWNQSFRV